LNTTGLFIVVALVVLVAILYIRLDYNGPKKIMLHPDIAFGLSCFRAKDLIVQEFDSKGNLWATRGMIIYLLKKGDNRFIRWAHVPVGFSFYWLNNFRLFRKLTLRSECVEMVVAEDGSVCAYSSGNIWNTTGTDMIFEKTMKLQHFGRGIGRGIMSTGLSTVNGNEFLFGEYFSNPERSYVKVFKYSRIGKCWEANYVFLPGEIRHIHAIQKDPYTGRLWICTGDEDHEPMIGWSEDYFKSIIQIGRGSQLWRACQLVFTEEAVFWGTDTGSVDLAGIYRWDRKDMELTKLYNTEGAVFYSTRLADGTIVMSTDRERFPNERDDMTRLFILGKDGRISAIPCGTWGYTKSGFRFNFAKLRFQRDQGNETLVISVLNQKEFPDGELLLLNQDKLTAAL
jgi:hypothetical protein